MRDKKRIKRILNKVNKLWDLYPDQRFFQLLSNYTQLGAREYDPFHFSDEDLEKYLDAGLKELRQKK